MNILQATGITKHFGGVVALNKADLVCQERRIVGLLGANGSGKSTMSRIINGTYHADEGTILYRGKEVRFHSPMKAAEAGISMVYQNLSLVPDLTVWENINLGREPRSGIGFLNNQESRRLAKEYIHKLCPWIGIHDEVRSLLPAELQLVEIVKGLVRSPDFLILDEPTAALEKTHVDVLFRLMRDLKKEGVSIIFISHRLQEVKEICDSVVVFRNGKTAGVIDFEKEEKDEQRIVHLITGEVFKVDDVKKRETSSTEKRLEVVNLVAKPKLYDLSFEIKAGEILGVSGLQGQGQEELMLALAGYIPIQSGHVSLDGNPVKLKHPRDAIREGMVLVPGNRQTEGLFLDHSLFMNIIYPKAALRKGPWKMQMKRLRALSHNLCKELTIQTPSVHTLANQLSGGNQQKVVVANWLHLKQKVLLLSDPAKGVDVQAKADLYNLVVELAESGTAVLVYASDNEELLRVCDRILILYEGQIVKDVKNKDITERELVNAAMRTIV